MEFGERNLLCLLILTITDNNRQDADEHQNHHEVIHILPVIMVGKLCRKYHRKLAEAESQREEIRIELATHILRAKDKASHTDEPQHHESFEETDDEACHNQYVNVLRTGAHPTQQELQSKIDH